MDPKWNEMTTLVYLGCGHIRQVPRIVNREGAATHPGMCEPCFNEWYRANKATDPDAWEAHIKDGGD